MAITRRFLLAGMASVAAAVAARGGAAPLFTEREASFRREYEWAARALLEALQSGDYSAWERGSEAEAPSRWRLARAVVTLREAGDLTELERTLRHSLEGLWQALTRPEWLPGDDHMENPSLYPLREVWQVWEAMPRQERVRMIREAVAARFGGDVRAERIAVYVTAQLMAINSAALGRLFNKNVDWTLRAVQNVKGESKSDPALATDLTGIQEALADRLATSKIKQTFG